MTGLPGADGATEPPGLAAAGPVDGGQVANLEMLTRALVGVTLQSLEVLSDEVSLPQFRLLLAAATSAGSNVRPG